MVPLAAARAAAHGLGAVEGGLVGWLGVVLLLLFAPQPGESLKFTVLLAGLALQPPYAAGFRVDPFGPGGGLAGAGLGRRRDRSHAAGADRGVALHHRRWTTGVSFNRLYQDGIFSAVPMVYSTLWEANIFGSYALTVGLRGWPSP